MTGKPNNGSDAWRSNYSKDTRENTDMIAKMEKNVE